jgi:hypothetical protein
MSQPNRSQLGLGILLVLIGAWFIARQTVPGLAEFAERFSYWPVTIIGVGGLILLIGLILGAPGMAVPAAIVAGIGGLLYYFDTTGNWDAWYFWLLVPGFVGVGSVLAGLLGENTRHNVRRGLNTMVVSAVLFLLFSAFFGGWKLLDNNYGPAVLIILLGLWVIGRGLFSTFRRKEQ